MVEATFLRCANNVEMCDVKFLEILYKLIENCGKMKER